MTTLLVWAATAHDTRYTASHVQTYYVHHGVPATLARDIDRRGYLAVRDLIEGGFILPGFIARDTFAARGHGVLVKYANGRTRIVRA